LGQHRQHFHDSALKFPDFAGLPENPRILPDGMRSATMPIPARSDCNRTACMTVSTSMAVFHQWLLADPASKAPACAIILHCEDSWPCARLITDIANYLNEYDDDGEGHWLPATPDLITKISHESSHRRLLGPQESSPAATSDPHTEHRQTLTDLGQRGHVVFRSPGLPDEYLNLPNTFHAGIGRHREIPEKCHLFLNSELMDQKCIAHIIGDVFLEWLHCEMRRGTPLHEIC
jgi:hypothetical protein